MLLLLLLILPPLLLLLLLLLMHLSIYLYSCVFCSPSPRIPASCAPLSPMSDTDNEAL